MGYTYKSNFEGDIRRFSSDSELSYQRLTDKVSNLYSLYDIEFTITYLDDGDNITIADNKDLEEAYKAINENDILRLTITRKSENNKNIINNSNNNINNNGVDSLFVQLLSNSFVQQMIPQVMNSLANNPALMTSIIQTAGAALRNQNINNQQQNNNCNNSGDNLINNKDILDNNSNNNNNNNNNSNNFKSINLKRASPHLLNASIGNNFHTHSTDSIVATLQPITSPVIDQTSTSPPTDKDQKDNRITLTSSNGNESCNGSFSSSISFELVNKESEDSQLYQTNSTSSSITSTSSATALNNRPPSPLENNINNKSSTSNNSTTTTTNNNNNNNNTNRLSGIQKSFLNMLPFTNIKNDKKEESNNNNNNVSQNNNNNNNNNNVTIGNTSPSTQTMATPNNLLSPQSAPISQSSPKQEHNNIISSSPSKFSPLPPPPNISHSPSPVFSHNFNNPYIHSTAPSSSILPPPPSQSNPNSTFIPTQPLPLIPQQQTTEKPQNLDQLNFIKEALQISEDEAKKLLIKHNGDLDKIFENN